MENAAKVMRSEGVKFRIVEIGGDYVTIKYQTLSGNNPNAYGNYVAEWRVPYDEVPWGTEPEKTCSVSSSSPTGSFSMDDLELTEDGYIFGYSVVPLKDDVYNFCATAYIPSTMPLESVDTDLNIEYCDPKLELLSVNTDTVRIKYSLPTGYSPQDNDNWIGLWEGTPDVYHKMPDVCEKVDKQLDASTITLGKTIKRGTKYTVCYYGGGWSSEETERSLKSPIYMLVFSAS